MNRPYFSLVVVAGLTLSALCGTIYPAAIADGESLAALLRAALLVAGVLVAGVLVAGVLVAGVLVLRALWRRQQDAAVGYARAGLADRLLATTLLAFVVGSAAWRVPRSTELE